MRHSKIPLTLPSGEIVQAQAPVIISASRATDIPAFYAEWLVKRLEQGYTAWRNPFNNKVSYVSFAQSRLIVFWTKNPKPLIPLLDRVQENIPNYYFQFTLNDYENDALELNVPPLSERIDTFIQLSERIGKEKVIWRFDPLILTDKIGVEDLLRKVENVGNRIFPYTEKLVFSFADIEIYRKVKSNLQRNQINYREFDETLMREFAQGMVQLNQKWNLELSTCSEPVSLESYGISHNSCIDPKLIARLFSHDRALMDFIGVAPTGNIFQQLNDFSRLKDKGQRSACGCILSKDIGAYDTCPHNCVYCYANSRFIQKKSNIFGEENYNSNK
ncbi:MAG: DUF1848 domain-containing protein [Bacteroidota bacterium]|nr:DUF1848 domain-containing protein [Bacteroidota bacterium]